MRLRRSPARLRLRVGVVVGAGFAATVVLAVTAPGWPVPVPVGRTEAPGLHGALVRQWAFYMALTVLVLAWLALVNLARTLPGGRRVRLVAVWVIAALWAIPLLAAPPLQSRDAYSYVAQGEMASHRIDPSRQGPSSLADERFTQLVSLNWTDSPAPYGPLAFGSGAALAVVAGHEPGGILAGTKLLAIAGIVLAAACLPVVARRHGANPAAAVALGVANPVVLLHLVGGAHHDALVLGLLCAAFALRARERRALAVVVASCAVAVKPTAAVAVFYLGWSWAWDWLGAGRGGPASARSRLRQTLAGAAAVVAAAGLYAVLATVTATGWGVVGAARSSTAVTTDLSLPQVAAMVADAGSGVGLLDRSRFVFAILALVACVVIWWFAGRLGALCAAALTLVAVSLGSPVLYPWYPTVALGLLAALPLGRWRPAYVAGVLTLTFAMHPGGGGVLAHAGGWRPLLAALYWVPLLATVAYGAWPRVRLRLSRARAAPRRGDADRRVSAV